MVKQNALNRYSDQFAVGEDAEGTTGLIDPLIVHTNQDAATSLDVINRTLDTLSVAISSVHSSIAGPLNTEATFQLGSDTFNNAATVGTNAQNRLCIHTNLNVDGITYLAKKSGGTHIWKNSGATPGVTLGTIDGSGAWTYPLQPAFLATASRQSDVTGNNTQYTVLFATEIDDRNEDFASPTFTAPSDGLYLLGGILEMEQMAGSGNYDIQIVTSNRTYLPVVADMSGILNAGNEIYVPWVQICDMDATDEATVTVTVNGIGADTADVGPNSTFYGWLMG